MELIYIGEIVKKDTKNLIRKFDVFKDGDTLRWGLTQNKIALFDTTDFDLLIQKEWRAAKARKTFYAVSGVRQLLFAHTYLGGDLPESITVDHRDMNGLDNRRSNLRLATVQQQMLNRSLIGASGSRGVTERKKDGMWRAEGRIDSIHFHIGYFNSKVQAAEAWDEYMFERFKNHNPLVGLERNGITGEPTLNFIHFNFPERLGILVPPTSKSTT